MVHIVTTTVSNTDYDTPKRTGERKKHFKYLGSMITNYGSCIREIKSWTVLAKTAFKNYNSFSLENCTEL
jgi:hypothetical protein